LQKLRAQNQTVEANETDYISFDLSQFAIYGQKKNHERDVWNSKPGELEMIPLHMLHIKTGCDQLLLDGILTYGNQSFYVEAVPVKFLSIGGYNDLEKHAVSDIWIQSVKGSQAGDVWYRLGNPNQEYSRYYETSLWVANLGKHFVDYLLSHADVRLAHFQNEFYKWLEEQHAHSINFQRWFRQFSSTDFRTVIAANVDHLWTEATNISAGLRHKFIWKEVDFKDLSAVRKQENVHANTKKTIVTPFVFKCFRNMYFAPTLEQREVKSPTVNAAQQARKHKMGFSTGDHVMQLLDTPPPELEPAPDPNSIRRSDVVGISKDNESAWKTKADIWFGEYSFASLFSHTNRL
jgi:DNA (cytosine-5)-methyltransferase 1